MEGIKTRITTLDGLRGVAILMVLLAHAESTTVAGYVGWLSPLDWLAHGGYGVQIFFVLSGYLISSILIREYDSIGTINIKAFYCRRILRIFPAFYAYLLFIGVLAATGVLQIPVAYFIFGATHLLNYSHAIMLLFGIPEVASPDYQFIGHFWTLSLEEQFYWIWPGCLLFLLRTRWYTVLVGVILALPVIRFASYYLFPNLRGQLGMMLHTGSDGIFSGCLLAIAMARYPSICQKLLLPGWAVAACPIYILFIEPFLVQVMPRGFELLLGVGLVNCAIILLLSNVLLQEKSTWYHWLLENPLLVNLGRISYSVYLWQQIFLTPLNTTWLGKWPICLVAAVVMGWISYRCLERPFVRMKDKFFSAHITQQAASELTSAKAV